MCGNRRLPWIQKPQYWRSGRSTLALLGSIQIDGRTCVYLLLTSLAGDPAVYPEIREAMRQRLAEADDDKMILDLRYNSGGDEARGLEFLQDIMSVGSTSPQDTEPLYYATNSFRLDPEDASRFYEAKRSPVQVVVKSSIRMVVLTSRNCVPSCEGLILALQAAGATLIGENTAGASGNPQPFPVPAVGEVFVSTWKAGDKNGVSFEVTGIAPDIIVNETATTTQDPILERAIEYLESLDETGPPSQPFDEGRWNC